MYAVIRNRLQLIDTRYLQLVVASFLMGNLIAVVLSVYWTTPRPLPIVEHYSYSTFVASNGVKLNAMQTSPDNIELKHITTNVSKTSDYGINGGFFWNGDLLSVAVIGDKPLKGDAGDYGSGWYNIDFPKGTLVWDEVTRSFSVQVVIEAGELKVTDRQHYWAQGGVSMSLRDENKWVSQAIDENMPAFDEARLRSGAVYDDQMNIWLLVSDKPCTVEQFRTAVKEVIAPKRLVDGIFLDGDGSSQMRNSQVTLKGDSREVYQMLALKEK
ncbi:hypothetical protein [Paenibacillus cremeus]|uniref:Phosphodiester glycosidase domain-containing protein n=1 Tax=Paenibacillus cremeus TaxID=2163881 RepID=A0A559KD04_9BACL|nr:hypothetical protein [Paenibacillus cremeus]TVY10018.1 hypothetical protein FPZ49_09840 [Paenibacillus cremeus]